MKAYLLAAGYATRLYPLTRDRAKPLLEVGGAPILTRILRRIESLQGLSEVVVISNARFAEQFQSWANEIECSVPLRVIVDGSMNEDDRLGAVGDLAFALGRVPTAGEDWLVVAGDNLLEFDLRPLQRSFLRSRRPTLVIRDVVHDGPSPYNEVTLDERQNVVSFREKPANPSSAHAAIALYFFTPEVATLLQRYLSEGGNPDAPGYFIEWLAREIPLVAARFDGDWFDIGSAETLADARERLRVDQG